MAAEKIRCKVEKVGECKYRVLRWKDERWQAWLENTKFDSREGSDYNAYYATPAAAKRAAAAAAAKERRESADCEEFEV